MTARYVLDKSAAYRTYVPAVRERLSPLMERGLLATRGIADLEAGVSARSESDHRELGIDRRDGLQYLTIPDEVWDRAWQVQEQLCGASLHRSVKIPDLIIAAVAEHHDLTALHYDHDFDRITDQEIEWVVPPGTADRQEGKNLWVTPCSSLPPRCHPSESSWVRSRWLVIARCLRKVIRPDLA